MVAEPEQLSPIDFGHQPCQVQNVGSVLVVFQVEYLHSEVQPLNSMSITVINAVADHEHFARFCILSILGLKRFVDVSSHYIIAEQY